MNLRNGVKVYLCTTCDVWHAQDAHTLRGERILNARYGGGGRHQQKKGAEKQQPLHRNQTLHTDAYISPAGKAL